MTKKKVIDDVQPSGFERHTQTILTALVAGLIAWVGMTVTNQSQQMAVLTEQVKSMSDQMKDLKEFARQPRFTKDDFTALIQPYQQRIETNQLTLSKRESWVTDIEKRVYLLERKIRADE